MQKDIIDGKLGKKLKQQNLKYLFNPNMKIHHPSILQTHDKENLYIFFVNGATIWCVQHQFNNKLRLFHSFHPILSLVAMWAVLFF
jgi:hypothetical protein